MQCSARNMCPTELMQRCRYGRNSGLCMEQVNENQCENEAICPLTKPVLYVWCGGVTRRCPDGVCVEHFLLCATRKNICTQGSGERADYP